VDEGRVLGLVADDPRAYASAHGAVLVDFGATREARTDVKSWLEAAAAIEGYAPREAKALVEVIVAKSGLGPFVTGWVSALTPPARVVLALAEAAVIAHRHGAEITVVVPEPPIAWPQRNEVRRLAVSLFAGCEVVLHAREAFELVPIVGVDFVVDESGGSIAPPTGMRSIHTRVFGAGEAYEAWRAALGELGVQIAGGPIAHVLAAPEGVGPREILAAAHKAGLDVLEVRDAFE
jgi:hypothetical protein